MKYTTLGTTDIKVSKICLGTMTWGQQNTEEEGHQQLDFALDKGVNFIDTAEMYSVPARPETYGSTEKIIGTWLKKTKKRDQVVLASKISGPSAHTAHIRSDGFSKRALNEALENSLKRLQTDYIDLYQLHWPERGVNCFGVREYPYKKHKEHPGDFLEILETLDAFVKVGKIRQIGLSNETPWGTLQYLQTAHKHSLPRVVSIQNSYSLLHRSYEYGMSEVSMRENVGLLAYSPLAFGVLSGKYTQGNKPKDARVSLFPNYSRYSSKQSEVAVLKYQEIAQKHGLSLAEMSLAFVNQLPFLTSTIIGATKMSQLKENLNSINIVLSKDIIDQINEVHKLIPNPAP
ncbi:oxidoreductase [Polaribacter pacificus]|uniref:Protein tas n=1 Tax=Polaribacter pacificus TaxID=1775173 RepID=A0A917HVS8_9FLAO|nr:NADP(H)-dependent aldo-keto reductase [Polaribacter pacificus]GGG93410.1 oxidoreductase [Polaribacter pacificus]